MARASTATSPRPGPLDQVGVRELRQNLSVYFEQVVAGESLEVTDRGRAVAMLVPRIPGLARRSFHRVGTANRAALDQSLMR